MKHPEDFRETFENWRTDFSVTLKEINQYIVANGSNVNISVSKDLDEPGFLVINLNKVPATLKVSEIEKIISKDGYRIINWRSNPGDIDFVASLAVTFDPFKVK